MTARRHRDGRQYSKQKRYRPARVRHPRHHVWGYDAATEVCDFRLPKVCSDEEKTLTSLVDDWDRYQWANPGKSSVVLARTRAEVRALSHLMRERRFAALPDGERADAGRVTVIVSRGTEDRADNLAAGDRTRRPAAHWRHTLGEAVVQIQAP